MNRAYAILLLVLLTCVSAGCGKYGKPYPPESLGATAPTDYQILPRVDGVEFKWKASLQDRRGKDLKFFDGFNIYRISSPDQEKIEDFNFDKDKLIGTLPDKHFQKFRALYEQAEKDGMPTRKVSLPEEDLTYSFVDENLEPGGEYGYFIVPFLYGDVRGEVRDVIVISYKGLQTSSYLYSLIDENDENAEEIDIDAALEAEETGQQTLTNP